ncbi:MAG: NAD(P)H-binding protein [Sphingobacterium sp.]
MKTIVIGGSGATGRELVLQLLADPRVETVTVLVRKSFFWPNPKLQEIVVDFDHLDQFADQIQGDVAFSTLGTTLKIAGERDAQWKVDHDYQIKFAEIARENKVFTFVLLSAAQASTTSSFFYNRMKGQIEQQIRDMNYPKLIIVQPGPIDRPESDRLGEKIAVSMVRFFNRIGLLKSYRPITTISLASVMIESSFGESSLAVEHIDPQNIQKLQEALKT